MLHPGIRFLGCLPILGFGLLLIGFESHAQAAEISNSTNQLSSIVAPKPLATALSPVKWQQVENAVDRGLAYIAARQAADGSFASIRVGQPGVTSLCLMAFLSRGHQPGLKP